jgi:hypothetical protein
MRIGRGCAITAFGSLNVMSAPAPIPWRNQSGSSRLEGAQVAEPADRLGHRGPDCLVVEVSNEAGECWQACAELERSW